MFPKLDSIRKRLHAEHLQCLSHLFICFNLSERSLEEKVQKVSVLIMLSKLAGAFWWTVPVNGSCREGLEDISVRVPVEEEPAVCELCHLQISFHLWAKSLA